MNFELTPKHIFRIIKRNWWIILITTAIFTPLMVIGGQYIPKTYSSNTLLLVKSKGLPDSYKKATIDESIKQRIANIKDQVLSRDRLSKIIKKYDLYSKVIENTSIANAIREMKQSIKVKIFASVFRISYEGKDTPEKIMKVTDDLASLFIEENLKYKQDIYSAYQFMEREVRRSKKKVENLEKKIAEYRHKHVGKLPEDLSANLAGRTSFLSQLDKTNQKLSEVEDQERLISKEFEIGIDNIILELIKEYNEKKISQLLSKNNKDEELTEDEKRLKGLLKNYQSLKSKLNEFISTRKDLLIEYTKNHPAIKNIEEKIRNIQKKLIQQRYAIQKEMGGTKEGKDGRQKIYPYVLSPEERKQKKHLIKHLKNLRNNYLKYKLTREELLTAKTRLENLEFTQIPPKVRKKLAKIKNTLAKLEPKVFDTANILLKDYEDTLAKSKRLFQIQLQRDYHLKKIKYCKKKVKFYEDRIKKTTVIEKKLAKLQRDYEIALRAYKTRIKNSEEVRLLNELKVERNAGEFIILDPAFLPRQSLFLQNLAIWFIGIGFGLSSGIGIGILRDMFRPRIEDFNSLQKVVDDKEMFIGIPKFWLPKWKMEPVTLKHIWPSLIHKGKRATEANLAIPSKKKKQLNAPAQTITKKTTQSLNVLKNTQQIRKEQLAKVEEDRRTQKKDLQRQLRDMEVPIKIGEVLVNKRLLVNNQVYRVLTILEEDLSLTSTTPPIELLPVSNLTTFFATGSEIASRYRRLKFQIFPKEVGKMPPKKVLFTSAVKGEGKTLTSFNIAGTFATGLADKIIWIDCNLNHPLVECFGEEDIKGLANVLAEDVDLSEAIRPTQFERFKILPAGKTYLNPSELLASKAMKQIVDQISSTYSDHFIIFDGPAVLSSIDITSLASLVESLVVVVQAHRTHPNILEKALNQLDDNKIGGFILNGLTKSELEDEHAFENA